MTLLLQLPKTNELEIFKQLSVILSKVVNSNVLENGIVAVRSDSKVPEEQLEEWVNIRTKLNAAGGIYRSRTKYNDKLKEVCDLWRRVGSSILQQTPGMNHCIDMAIKKVTVAKCNNRRIQMNTYTYNIVGKQKVILLI